LEVGSLAISLGNVLAFLITVWAAFLLSRFLHFMLEEDIYPRVRLARGVPYAISTMVNYVILLVGFLFAVAAMGIDMTNFTILAGAFGVGQGFGLQNIVNNFVSGLILLFERPVNVGDVIQVGCSKKEVTACWHASQRNSHAGGLRGYRAQRPTCIRGGTKLDSLGSATETGD